MTTNIIPLDAVTPRQIETAIRRFLESEPDAAKWQDYFRPASHGATVMGILAAFGAFLSHQARAVRRESNLATARLDSSIRAIAYTLGYPIRRRRAARLDLVFADRMLNRHLSLGSSLTDRRIGTWGGHPISLIEEFSATVAEGNRTLKCALGDWVSHPESGAAELDNVEFAELEFTPRGADGAQVDPADVDDELVSIFLLEELAETKYNLFGPDAKIGVFMEDLNVTGTAFADVGGETEVLVKTLVSSIVATFGGMVGTATTLGKRPTANARARAEYLVVANVPAEFSYDPASALAISVDDFTADDVTIENVARMLPADDAGKVARVVPGYFSSKRRMVTAADHEAIILAQPEIYDCKVVTRECSIDPVERGNAAECLATRVNREAHTIPQLGTSGAGANHRIVTLRHSSSEFLGFSAFSAFPANLTGAPANMNAPNVVTTADATAHFLRTFNLRNVGAARVELRLAAANAGEGSLSNLTDAAETSMKLALRSSMGTLVLGFPAATPGPYDLVFTAGAAWTAQDYDVDDVVTNGGKTWRRVADEDTTNAAPSEGSVWKEVSLAQAFLHTRRKQRRPFWRRGRGQVHRVNKPRRFGRGGRHEAMQRPIHKWRRWNGRHHAEGQGFPQLMAAAQRR